MDESLSWSWGRKDDEVVVVDVAADDREDEDWAVVEDEKLLSLGTEIDLDSLRRVLLRGDDESFWDASCDPAPDDWRLNSFIMGLMIRLRRRC